MDPRKIKLLQKIKITLFMKLTVVTAKLKSRSNEHKRSVKNCDCENNEIARHSWAADHNFSWNQKKVVDRESRSISGKIKETIHS